MVLGPGIPCRDDGLPTALVAFGDIDYGEFPDRASTWLGNRTARSLNEVEGSEVEAPLANHGSAPLTNQLLRKTRDVFSPLPATGLEVEAVAAIYKERTNQPAVVYTGPDASDYRLQHLPEPPRVLHLATHGFFLEDKSQQSAEHAERPMTLGGLALAGANRGIKGETGPDGEDGILYALEAQNLNLEGTELVVLSACDTGKGEVDYSEGVYGLTRAFRTAGARNILMTLWPLNDALAAQFMLDFYENWLSGASTSLGNHAAKTPADALHETRLAWINSEDERKRNPRYWAPYVLVE
uniref:CHAT domain-containing protein n=1 Tax=Candidatus Kentrum sp. LFY TaxID=2126342 RepID=A0A450WKC2_9GAMM|nr:MAG: CHAT domain-containing protein [Candidatus Kentron sp. LFY]